MKTEKSVEPKNLIHRYIECFANLRIHDDQGLFKVQLKAAYEMFRDVPDVLGEAVIAEVYKNHSQGDYAQISKGNHRIPKRAGPRVWMIPFKCFLL